MLSNEKKTNFSISYAELSILTHQSCDTIKRDIADFERFGITNSVVEALKSQAEVLDNTPKDEELQGVVMDITIAKNEIAEQTKSLIREAVTFIKLVYNTNTGVYKALDVSQLNKKTNYALYNTAYGVIRVAKLKANDFAPALQDVIDELEVVSNQLLEKLQEKCIAIQDRDIATHNRVELANSIYSEFSKLNSLGQAIWVERNESKYNDYIIYGNKKKTENAPPENTNENEEELPNE